jgi:hypothetical protein
MPSKQPPIPPMPARLMFIPVIVGVFSIILGVLEFNRNSNVWGWILVVGGVAIIIGNYIARRGVWRNDPSYRSRFVSRR